MHATLWLGMSTNGMIADKNGHEDFLSNRIWQEFVKQITTTGCVVMGKNAYLKLRENIPEYSSDVANIFKVVLSADNNLILEQGWHKTSSPEKAINLLKTNGFDHATVTGGSRTCTSFLRANLINEIIYLIEPVIKGEGIPSFFPNEFERKLKLVSSTNIGELVQLRYNLLK